MFGRNGNPIVLCFDLCFLQSHYWDFRNQKFIQVACKSMLKKIPLIFNRQRPPASYAQLNLTPSDEENFEEDSKDVSNTTTCPKNLYVVVCATLVTIAGVGGYFLGMFTNNQSPVAEDSSESANRGQFADHPH